MGHQPPCALAARPVGMVVLAGWPWGWLPGALGDALGLVLVGLLLLVVATRALLGVTNCDGRTGPGCRAAGPLVSVVLAVFPRLLGPWPVGGPGAVETRICRPVAAFGRCVLGH